MATFSSSPSRDIWPSREYFNVERAGLSLAICWRMLIPLTGSEREPGHETRMKHRDWVAHIDILGSVKGTAFYELNSKIELFFGWTVCKKLVGCINEFEP